VWIFSHRNRGHSHSHLHSFPLLPIAITKLEFYSHSHSIPIPIGNKSHSHSHLYYLATQLQELIYHMGSHSVTRILLKQETVSSSGIGWAICKSAPRSRQHLSTQFFYRPDALPAAQPTASMHWRQNSLYYKKGKRWWGFGCNGTICKQSAPRSRHITTPTPNCSIFTGRMLFLTPNRQCQSTEGRYLGT